MLIVLENLLINHFIQKQAIYSEKNIVSHGQRRHERVQFSFRHLSHIIYGSENIAPIFVDVEFK